jgi:hypothetical protein
MPTGGSLDMPGHSIQPRWARSVRGLTCRRRRERRTRSPRDETDEPGLDAVGDGAGATWPGAYGRPDGPADCGTGARRDPYGQRGCSKTAFAPTLAIALDRRRPSDASSACPAVSARRDAGPSLPAIRLG